VPGGEANAESPTLEPLEFYAENGIDFQPAATVTKMDRAARAVSLSNQSTVAHDIAVIATGMLWQR
jgi:3-phenylpropionate/trans-cinnamate dioxygenase ferredoxin reductase subunit